MTGKTFICTGLPPVPSPVANLVATPVVLAVANPVAIPVALAVANLVILAVAPLDWLAVIHDNSSDRTHQRTNRSQGRS